jgi:hypothetical protein
VLEIIRVDFGKAFSEEKTTGSTPYIEKLEQIKKYIWWVLIITPYEEKQSLNEG